MRTIVLKEKLLDTGNEVNKDYVKTITQIASMMVNMETGMSYFDDNGVVNAKPLPFNTVKIGNIEYEFHLTEYALYIVSEKLRKFMSVWEQFKTTLHTEINNLYAKLNLPDAFYTTISPLTTQYTIVEELFTPSKIKNTIDIKMRQILRANEKAESVKHNNVYGGRYKTAPVRVTPKFTWLIFNNIVPMHVHSVDQMLSMGSIMIIDNEIIFKDKLYTISYPSLSETELVKNHTLCKNIYNIGTMTNMYLTFLNYLTTYYKKDIDIRSFGRYDAYYGQMNMYSQQLVNLYPTLLIPWNDVRPAVYSKGNWVTRLKKWKPTDVDIATSNCYITGVPLYDNIYVLDILTDRETDICHLCITPTALDHMYLRDWQKHFGTKFQIISICRTMFPRTFEQLLDSYSCEPEYLHFMKTFHRVYNHYNKQAILDNHLLDGKKYCLIDLGKIKGGISGCLQQHFSTAVEKDVQYILTYVQRPSY